MRPLIPCVLLALCLLLFGRSAGDVAADDFVLEGSEGHPSHLVRLAERARTNFYTRFFPLRRPDVPPVPVQISYPVLLPSDRAAQTTCEVDPVSGVVSKISVEIAAEGLTPGVVAHETAHVCMALIAPNAPDWLQEGVACAMETPRSVEKWRNLARKAIQAGARVPSIVAEPRTVSHDWYAMSAATVLALEAKHGSEIVGELILRDAQADQFLDQLGYSNLADLDRDVLNYLTHDLPDPAAHRVSAPSDSLLPSILATPHPFSEETQP